MLTPMVDNAALGYVGVEERTAGTITNRYVLHPGKWLSPDTWGPTDLTDQPDEVRALCLETWTPEVVAAYQQVHVWAEPMTAMQMFGP